MQSGILIWLLKKMSHHKNLMTLYLDACGKVVKCYPPDVIRDECFGCEHNCTLEQLKACLPKALKCSHGFGNYLSIMTEFIANARREFNSIPLDCEDPSQRYGPLDVLDLIEFAVHNSNGGMEYGEECADGK